MGMQKPMRVLCARELQNSIGDSVHKLLSDLIAEYNLEQVYEVQKSIIKGINGTEFIFKGLKYNSTEIKSTEGIDVAWIEEAEKVSDASWEMLIPTVRKPNSEIWITFNTKNLTDPTYQRFVVNADQDMLVRKVSWRDNPFFPAVLESERQRLKASDLEAYAHVWEGEPDSRRSGSIYARWITDIRTKGQICSVPYDRSSQVITAWDLGKSDATAIWFGQMVGKQPRVIDYYSASGQDLEHYVKVIKNRDYNYQAHYLPHDSRQQRLGQQYSIEGQLRMMGLNIKVLPIAEVEAGIDLVRQFLPNCWLDSVKCKHGINALESYQYQWDETRQMFKPNPLHDWASDPADAFRYLVQAFKFSDNKTKIQTHYQEPPSRNSWMAS